MKNLQIGQRVIVRGISHASYDGNDQRIIVTGTPEAPFNAVVVGQCVKYLGKYKGSKAWSSQSDYYEPATLKVTGSVMLWEVRHGMTNKVLLVRDEDLEPTDQQFTIPRRAGKISLAWPASPEPEEPAPLLLTYQP